MNIVKDIIYTAGYFDGDASFFCRKQLDKRDGFFYYRYGVKVTSTNPEIISYFKNTYGGCIGKRNFFGKRQNCKQQFNFQINGKKSNLLIKSVLPYLVEKRKEAKLICDFISSNDEKEKDKIVDKLKVIKHKKNLIQIGDKQKILNCRNTIKPTKEDFIYLAGFIDAECCLSIRQSSPILYFNNTKIPIFYWISQRFGGHIYICKKRNPSIRNKFQWSCLGKSLYQILPIIIDHLRYKKRVCEKLIEFTKTIKTTKKLSTSTIEKRKSIIQDVHKFNHAGLTHT